MFDVSDVMGIFYLIALVLKFCICCYVFMTGVAMLCSLYDALKAMPCILCDALKVNVMLRRFVQFCKYGYN